MYLRFEIGLEKFQPQETQVRGVSSKTVKWRR